MNKLYLRRLLIGLMLSTLAALLWHRYALNSILEIDAGTSLEVRAIDDSSVGGKSSTVLKRVNGKLVLECEIRTGYEWPFCEIAIELKKPPGGLDFTRYETVRLWVHYDGPESPQQVRFFIRNFNPAYARADDLASLKVQEIVYDPSRYVQPLEAHLSQFEVASWWTNDFKIPVEYGGLEFNNVSVLEVSTGNTVLPGMHRITLDRIEFGGKVISPAAFRLIIIGLWLLAAFSFLVVDGMNTRRRLLTSNRKQSSLKKINEALRVQTKIFAKLARHDPLTGVLNRNGLGDELVRLASNRDEQIFPLSLIFIDVDHFKSINDQFGHSVGDQVIRGVAQIIRADIQRDDLFARWGGEEFLLVCPLTGSHEAARIAERLRQIIADGEYAEGVRVTSSFGVAELGAGEDLSDGIKRADEAMYRAKQNGRNRVEVQLAADEEAAA